MDEDSHIVFDNIAFEEKDNWWKIINKYNLNHKVNKAEWQETEIINHIWYNNTNEIVTGTNPLERSFTGFVIIKGEKKNKIADFLERVSYVSSGRDLEEYKKV